MISNVSDSVSNMDQVNKWYVDKHFFFRVTIKRFGGYYGNKKTIIFTEFGWHFNNLLKDMKFKERFTCTFRTLFTRLWWK